MKKTVIPAFLILLFSVSWSLAQPSTFQVVVDLGASENACDLKQTPDGGYIVSGMQFTGSTSSLKIFLMKFAADGSTQWTKTYTGAVANGANLYQNYRVITTGEGGYLVVGTSATGGNDMLVMKTDAAGDTLWVRTYGSGGGDAGNSVFEADNGDYVIGGSCLLGGQRRMGFLRISSSGSIVSQAFHADGIASPWFEYVRLDDNEVGIVHSYSSLLGVVDSNGTLQWTLPLGLGSSYSVDAAKLDNGEYLIYGLGSGLTGGAYALVRSNSAGSATLRKKYSTSYDESPRNMLVTSTGNYVLYGLSTSMNGPSALMACEIDTAGNVLWSNRYSYSSGSNHEAGRIIRTADGGYAMVGQYDHSGNYTDYDVYLVKTDSAGQSGCNQQTFTFNVGVVNPVAQSPFYTYTGAFTNSGTPFSTTVASAAVTNSTVLCLSTGIDSPTAQSMLTVFPNPATDRLTILPADGHQGEFRIFDVSGRLVHNGNAEGETVVDLSGLSEGVFTLHFTDQQGNSRMARFFRHSR